MPQGGGSGYSTYKSNKKKRMAKRKTVFLHKNFPPTILPWELREEIERAILEEYNKYEEDYQYELPDEKSINNLND